MKPDYYERPVNCCWLPPPPPQNVDGGQRSLDFHISKFHVNDSNKNQYLFGDQNLSP